MNNLLLRFILITLLFLPVTLYSTEVTGDWVARRMSDRDTGSDSRVEMEMELVDSKGRIIRRDLFMIRKDFGGVDRMLVRFTRPADIRGTSFLVWEQEGEEDVRFLYLPALGRTRRITSAERTDSFAGTDFTYEDISGLEYEEFTYRLLGDSTLTTGEDCYILESIPKHNDTDYARSLTLVDKESFLPVSADYIDSREKTLRHFSLVRKEKISGIWTMREMTMEDLENEHKTHIVTVSVQYNQGISDQMFTRRELERGAQ